MKIEVLPSEEIKTRVADLLSEQIKRNPKSVLGMTTGSSPIKYGIYQEWIRREQAGEFSFHEARFINPDELVGIPADHPESYRTYMQEHLFGQLQTLRYEPQIPDGSSTDLKAECLRFDQLLADLGYVDWQLMGLGLNGHIAFIEPSNHIPAKTYVSQLFVENRPVHSPHFRSEEEVPKQSITIGLEAVMKARNIVLVATGDNKAEMVAKAFAGPITTSVPASFLQLHASATIILDAAAASKLSL
ncbi:MULTISPECIES: glucosamine-6-phosphate deaminase [Paenibacillus]|uniref:Glucosamine-6-phosphate deaminase n=1 Tax=Paenibacillus violae TaxID=3077234 RepID=A0ABU3RGB5_9BACL|nr:MULTISPECIES: glucosamine-6-phosphate deaminase [Paenibacillus]MDU0203306.1 glucosamine-6-phosphate deaminase [Paenibacillus sp. PFR10]MEC0270043.1 glucosamine-6-phosphate deaminase [Paenibacillus anseongense]